MSTTANFNNEIEFLVGSIEEVVINYIGFDAYGYDELTAPEVLTIEENDPYFVPSQDDSILGTNQSNSILGTEQRDVIKGKNQII